MHLNCRDPRSNRNNVKEQEDSVKQYAKYAINTGATEANGDEFSDIERAIVAGIIAGYHLSQAYPKHREMDLLRSTTTDMGVDGYPIRIDKILNEVTNILFG